MIAPRLQELGKSLDDRTLVQLARSDHATFKKRVFDTLVGAANTKEHELPDNHNCRFGKWYDALRNEALKNSTAYRRIEEPHRLVHACGKEALALFHQGKFEAAVGAAARMEDASRQVYAALDEMAAVLPRAQDRR
jgi:methyl-accepting chemotaxis protein